MQSLSDVLWVFSRIDVLAVVDILLVALIFYALLRLIQGTQAVQLLRGIIPGPRGRSDSGWWVLGERLDRIGP